MYLLGLKTYELIIFGIAILFLGWSTFLNYRDNSLSIKFLFIGSFFIGLFYAGLDPFLNLWDEQFHALVAKNLAKDFFTPKLYNKPSLPLDYKYWVANEFWLHKQPLFLWQMALSIKLFGATIFAVRLPSVLMHSLIPILIYRIGDSTLNKNAAFYGALIFAVSSYPLELMVGKYSTDHNDIAFLFYTTASFWTWFEYQQKKDIGWLFLIGLFAGFAVLVKWLMGLLIFVIWALVKLIADKKKLFILRSYLPLFFSFIISLVVFLPWQCYIFQVFPDEANYEFTYNSKHLYEAIEGHGGDWTFHFTKGAKKLYGDSNLILLIIVFAFILMMNKLQQIKAKVFFLSLIVFVYLFFSIVATKMISYPIVAFPFICLSIGCLIDVIGEALKPTRLKPLIVSLSLVCVCFTSFNFEMLHYNHIENRKRNEESLLGEFKELKMIESLDAYLKQEDYILFNNSITPYGYIPTMFFTDYESYSFIPTKEQLEILQRKDKKIACLKIGQLPEYIVENKSIVLIPIPSSETKKSH